MSEDVKVLVVEDSLTQALQLKYILERYRYAVRVANNGKEALDLLSEYKPTLIISDIVMPEMNGYELCKEIKSNEILREIPVILLTSLSDPLDILKGLECGADNFLTKPYDERLLLSRVRYILLNREMREGARTHWDMEILFRGQKFTVTPERQQILDLLISTYETAVQKNLELMQVQEELRSLNESLEEKVEERTAELLAEVGERKRAEQRLIVQHDVTRRLAESATHDDAMQDILQTICENLHWDLGEFWNVDRERNLLVRSASWNAQSIDCAKLESRKEITLEMVDDIAHRVWQSGKAIWTTEVKDMAFSEKAIFPNTKLCSACCLPIQIRQEVIAVMNFFSCEARPIDESVINILSIISNQIGQFIERRLMEEALQESEERLRQAQKMEAIGTMAGGVAHDFNNLLTAILGNTHLALLKISDDHPIHHYLLEVEKASNKATALTRQMLAFGRRQRLERRTINLNDTIADIARMLQRIIGEDVEMRLKVAKELSTVFADPTQIEQIVMNLAVNARDAMPEGGTLTIETHNVELDEAFCRQYPYAQPGNYVQIRVSDTGVGMNEDVKAHIFEPFFTTKEVGKGTGLGLAMVYGIVNQHDGYIHVYSEAGHGTIFKIYLPATESVLDGTKKATQLPLLGGMETLLIAEDEESLRGLAKDVLEGLGYKVILAQNGEEAVDIYKRSHEQIDLVILDMVMPRMGGPEASHLIYAISHNVPIIFMTGYSEELVQEKFVKREDFIKDVGTVLIQKPYNVEGLGRKVREVLDSQRERRTNL